MKHLKPLPPLDALNRLFRYEPDTGKLIWLISRKGSMAAGDEAGTIGPDGYNRVTISRKQYAAHRIAWKMFNGIEPTGIVDHRDRQNANNRISNLRHTDQRRNLYNATIRSDSPTGVKGVVINQRIGKRFMAIVKTNGRRQQCSFDTLEEAKVGIKTMREKAHGEFACHGEDGLSARRKLMPQQV